uniref:Uncharacterized protein n=1 Tax=Cucumis melo TaxID=3656 RepID=A0A9I9EGR2_CUCME
MADQKLLQEPAPCMESNSYRSRTQLMLIVITDTIDMRPIEPSTLSQVNHQIKYPHLIHNVYN